MQEREPDAWQIILGVVFIAISITYIAYNMGENSSKLFGRHDDDVIKTERWMFIVEIALMSLKRMVYMGECDLNFKGYLSNSLNVRSQEETWSWSKLQNWRPKQNKRVQNKKRNLKK